MCEWWWDVRPVFLVGDMSQPTAGGTLMVLTVWGRQCDSAEPAFIPRPVFWMRTGLGTGHDLCTACVSVGLVQTCQGLPLLATAIAAWAAIMTACG